MVADVAQANDTTLGLRLLLGAIIGVYAARRAYGKKSFKQLSSFPILGGALFGALLLDVISMATSITGGVEPGIALMTWIIHGLGAAFVVGLPAAFMASRSSAGPMPTDPNTPSVVQGTTKLRSAQFFALTFPTPEAAAQFGEDLNRCLTTQVRERLARLPVSVEAVWRGPVVGTETQPTLYVSQGIINMLVDCELPFPTPEGPVSRSAVGSDFIPAVLL